jgi:phosphate starvation-inducible PhoH-like protein
MLAGDEQRDSRTKDGHAELLTRRTDVQARTPTQALYLENIAQHDITFGIGPAGTGKTYLAVASAVDALERSAVQRIVLDPPCGGSGRKARASCPATWGKKSIRICARCTTLCMT